MTIDTFWSSTISQAVAATGTTAGNTTTAPASLTPEVFVTWTHDDQVAYIKAKGSGTPPSVIIGSGTDTATLSLTDSPLPEVIITGPGIIQATSGDSQPIPYEYLNGSSTGSPSAIVTASAEALFPTLDGVTHTLPESERPANFSKDVTAMTLDADKTAFLQDFATWDSSYQLEYIKLHGSPQDAATNPSGGGRVLDVSVAGPPAVEFTAVVSITDPTKFYIVQSLDKDAIAKMSLVDQTKIAGLTAFTNIASSLGLSPASSATVQALYAKDPPNSTTPKTVSLTDYIDDVETQITSQQCQNRSGTLDTAAQTALLSQLDILKEQLANSGIVSPADIQQKVSDINDRFKRLFAFWDVAAPTPDTQYMGKPDDSVTVYHNVVSLDGDLTGIQHGYQVFLAQEQRIADLANERMQLVRDNGIFLGKHLDVPMLVYKFQANYSDSLDAEVTADTEEVNQQNALLKTYAAIQDIINQTLSKFTKADDGSKVLYGKEDSDVPDEDDYDPNKVDYTYLISSTDLHTLSMFEDLLGAGQKSPMETILGISRPLFDFFRQNPGEDSNYDLNSYSQPQWSTYGTRLSETVTLINQNSQIQMNDINSLSKEKDRHFDLANNALSKMADIIENIARAGG
jgi:hypothetical protein